MKAIGIKMVELQPMTAREANDKGHRIGNHSFEEEGYEVIYPDGYKSWSPKDVADAAYYPLSENNDGTKIFKMEEIVNDLWTHLGFVLQWAKYGIDVKPKENK